MTHRPAPLPLDTDPTAIGQTAEGVGILCDGSLARAAQLLDEVRALVDRAAGRPLTWDETLGKFDDVLLAVQTAAEFAQLMAATHPDKAVRDAAKECEPKVDAFTTTLYLDVDIAAVIKRYAAQNDVLPPAHARLLRHTLRDYRRNGLELDDVGRDRLCALNEEITTISQAFDTNIAEATLAIRVTPDRLAGLPPAYVATHPTGPDGLVAITTDYPDYLPFVQYAEDRAAALELFKLFDNRAADKNVALLERLLALRHEKARLLGYSTWADYVLEPRMAKDAATVSTFLEGLRTHLAVRGADEMRELRAMHAELGGGVDDPLPPCERVYLEDQLRRRNYGLNSQEVTEYFEVGRVKDGLLAITAKMYGVRYREVDLPVWHSDVTAVEVVGAHDEVIGRFYFDLYPRPDKYKHAAVFGIRASKTLVGGRLVPIAAIVCNFPRAQGETPGLMPHGEVVTFFHEFGHVLHQVLTESPLAAFSGTNVARDFVESPSQMFEEWAWSRETLAAFARHYRTGAPLPDALFAAMTRARTFGRALGTQRQLFLSALDLAYHTREPGFDTTALLAELHAVYTPFAYVAGTHFQAGFGHLIGYDAGYYGYQWALSIARDLFGRFRREGLLSPATASAYRAAVLAPGGSADEIELVRRFLGRDPNDVAYRRYLDGDADAA